MRHTRMHTQAQGGIVIRALKTQTTFAHVQCAKSAMLVSRCGRHSILRAHENCSRAISTLQARPHAEAETASQRSSILVHLDDLIDHLDLGDVFRCLAVAH